MHLGEVNTRELDVEAALKFSQHVLCNAAQLWAEGTLDQKQKLQSVIFPEGVTFNAGSFGTAKISLVFSA